MVEPSGAPGRAFFVSEQMTRAYLLKVLGRFEAERDWLKLLDTREEFEGRVRNNVRELLVENFEQDTSGIASVNQPITGSKSLILNKEKHIFRV